MSHNASAPLKQMVIAAIDEATARGAGSVESEHLLLAVADKAEPGLRSALTDLGLDRASIDRLLREERRRSLEAAGVQQLPDWVLAIAPRGQRPRWGASIRSVLVRAGTLAKESDRRRIAGVDVVRAIAEAEFGTVPRLLALAGVSRDVVGVRLRAL